MARAVIPKGLNKLGFAMWTPTTRQQHSRTVTRYQTDLTDAEWQVIAPHLPKSCATGRPREWHWHKCDVLTASGNVRVRRQTGRYVLIVSSSDFDPFQTSAASL